jgi:aldehyde dehydrogenase (NAD+)
VVGPLIDERSADVALAAVERSGGTVLTGGAMVPGRPRTYLQPTLVELDRHAGPLVEHEVFAPVATLIGARDRDDAVDMANASRYGLVAGVHTKRLDDAMHVGDRLRAGLIRVNAPTSGVDYHVPFGGVRASSAGPREQGTAAREFYTETTTVLVSP